MHVLLLGEARRGVFVSETGTPQGSRAESPAHKKNGLPGGGRNTQKRMFVHRRCGVRRAQPCGIARWRARSVTSNDNTAVENISIFPQNAFACGWSARRVAGCTAVVYMLHEAGSGEAHEQDVQQQQPSSPAVHTVYQWD